MRERYVRALLSEIACTEIKKENGGHFQVCTVFFGGGTPSLLTGDQIHRILDGIRSSFELLSGAEISMEANPGTVNRDSLRQYRAAGVNRLSIGVQSLCDSELKLLGRIHTARQARETFLLARKEGFENINLDLMSALPGQTFGSWAETLRDAAAWEPEHLSAYSLIIEPGTPFARRYEEGSLPSLPDEEEDRRMYHYTKEFLESRGYHRYEISNYALPGKECRHNVGYWTGRPYLGFGIGAASFWDGTRYSNIAEIGSYLEILEEKAGISGKEYGNRRPGQCTGRSGPSVGHSGRGVWLSAEHSGRDAGLPDEYSGRDVGQPTKHSGRDAGLPDEYSGRDVGQPTEHSGRDAGLPDEYSGRDVGQPTEHSGRDAGLPCGCSGLDAGSSAGRSCREAGPNAAEALRTDLHRLKRSEQMEEFMFLGLRMTRGVRNRDFLERFGVPMEDVYGEILSKHIATGVLERTREGVCLTSRGTDVSNYVLADYLL